MNQPTEELQQQIEELKNSWSRERAEFINFRKRKQLEYNKNRQAWLSNFVSELLPSMDNLGRVLNIKSENQELRQFVQGVAMVKDDILKVFGNHNIRIMSPEPHKSIFDPHTMEAVSVCSASSLGVSENTVVQVYQPAYVLETQEQSVNTKEGLENTQESLHVIQTAKVQIAVNKKDAELSSEGNGEQ